MLEVTFRVGIGPHIVRVFAEARKSSFKEKIVKATSHLPIDFEKIFSSYLFQGIECMYYISTPDFMKNKPYIYLLKSIFFRNVVDVDS